MKSVTESTFVKGTTNYQFDPENPVNFDIIDAPDDIDSARWSVLYDRELSLMYFLKQDSDSTMYQFGFNGEAFKLGHRCMPQTEIEPIPEGTEPSNMASFAMMFIPKYTPPYPSDEHGEYRLFFLQQRSVDAYKKRLENLEGANDPSVVEETEQEFWLNQFLYKEETNTFRLDGSTGTQFQILGFPADTDWSRWSMLYDDEGDALSLPNYRIYAFKKGSNTELYHGTFDGSIYRYAYKQSIPLMTITNIPEQADQEKNIAMLYNTDSSEYHLYMQNK